MVCVRIAGVVFVYFTLLYLDLLVGVGLISFRDSLLSLFCSVVCGVFFFSFWSSNVDRLIVFAIFRSSSVCLLCFGDGYFVLLLFCFFLFLFLILWTFVIWYSLLFIPL